MYLKLDLIVPAFNSDFARCLALNRETDKLRTVINYYCNWQLLLSVSKKNDT